MSSLEALVGSMTINDLAERSGRSVQAIVGYAMDSRSSPKRKSSNGVPARKTSGRSAIDTRTAAGRAEFDERVLEAVEQLGGEAGTADIAKIVGGTPLQRRTALARLVKRRKLSRSGQARSTTYAVR